MDELTIMVRDGVTKDGAIDIDRLQIILKELNEIKKSVKEAAKKTLKEKNDAAKEQNSSRGKAYYNSLSVGDEFFYVSSDGTEFAAKKIETKSKTGSTAACELINPPANAKTTKRYPKFWQVQVPAEFVVEEVA